MPHHGLFIKEVKIVTNKYQREIKPGVYVDVYDVLKAFEVSCPAMAHAIKKCLAPGQRGVKDAEQDKEEAIMSITRSIMMDAEQRKNVSVAQALYNLESMS